jgi:hypothetical protein
VAAIAMLNIAMYPVHQSVDSPGHVYTARLIGQLIEGGPVPYGAEVSVSSAWNPFGRFGGLTLWMGYCAGGSLSWKSATDLELDCPPHADAKDVYLAANQERVKLRVIRRK